MILQYILIILTIAYILWFAYIKIKYPFWNIQPVYHTYDFWRGYCQSPFYIYKYRPIKTKFCNSKNIRTYSYFDVGEEEISKIIYLLQSNYILNDRILFTMQKSDIDNIFKGHMSTPYVSFYYDFIYEKKDNAIQEKREPNGCIFSYPVNIYFQNSSQDKEYSKDSLYFIDFLCIHRDKDSRKGFRELFQTHEYNQRIQNQEIIGSLIKREIELFDGIVPLVEYTSYVYYLRNVIFRNLPAHFHVLHIDVENIDILTDFLFVQTHLDLSMSDKHYDFLSVTSIGNYIELIKSNMCFVFCLKQGEHIYGMYFFKDAKIQYEDLEGNVLQFYGGIMNTNSADLFYVGFMHSLHQIMKKFPEFKILIFENIGDNMIIHSKWRVKNTPIFENKCAYYTFNWVYPSSPIGARGCMIL